MNSTRRLTIGLPVYNGARYLRECLTSLLDQDMGDFELIVSDNASTDETDQIALEFSRLDSRVRYVRQPHNVGAAANFNAVFKLADSPFFKWACADDVCAPAFLRRALCELEQNRGAVLCYGQTTLIDGEGRPLGVHAEGLDLRSPDVTRRFWHTRQRTGLLHVLQGVWRTAALRGSALMGSFTGSDEALVVEMSLRGTFHELTHPMLLRRMHAAAASAGTTLAARQEHLDPRTRGDIELKYWRHAIEHLRAVARAPLPIAVRLDLAATELRAMIGTRDHLTRELVEALRQLLQKALPGSAATKRA